MSIKDKLVDLGYTLKFGIEDIVFAAKNKVLDVTDYIKYDILKQYPECNLPPISTKKSKKRKSSKKKKK